jgi:hypothetical protein
MQTRFSFKKTADRVTELGKLSVGDLIKHHGEHGSFKIQYIDTFEDGRPDEVTAIGGAYGRSQWRTFRIDEVTKLPKKRQMAQASRKTAALVPQVGDLVTYITNGGSPRIDVKVTNVDEYGGVFDGEWTWSKNEKIWGYIDQIIEINGVSVTATRKRAERQYVTVQAPSTYKTYLPVRGGKYHLTDGLYSGHPYAACRGGMSLELDDSTLQLISCYTPVNAHWMCPKCVKIIEKMEAERNG